MPKLSFFKPKETKIIENLINRIIALEKKMAIQFRINDKIIKIIQDETDINLNQARAEDELVDEQKQVEYKEKGEVVR